MAALERDITVTRNGHLNTGMHGNYFMTKYLIEQRRNDLLALMHTKEDFPSFGYMIRNGATTIWEEWDGDNSQIHNTMISVGLWFIEGLAGIRYDEKAPGFQHFIAAPGIESGLKRVDASLDDRLREDHQRVAGGGRRPDLGPGGAAQHDRDGRHPGDRARRGPRKRPARGVPARHRPPGRRKGPLPLRSRLGHVPLYQPASAELSPVVVCLGLIVRLRIEAVEPDAGIGRGEAPLGTQTRTVAVGLPGGHLWPR